MKRTEKYYLLIMRIALVLGTGACLAILIIGIAYKIPLAFLFGGLSTGVLVMADALLLVSPDFLQSQATEQILKVTTDTLSLMEGGLDEKTAQAVCNLLLPETNAMAIAITDTENVLAYAGEGSNYFVGKMKISTEDTKDAIQSKHMQTFSSINRSIIEQAFPEIKNKIFIKAGIVVPLIVQDEVMGTLKFYYKNKRAIDNAQLAIAYGFGQVLSMELSTHELDKQVALTARAEVKALQSQINPHFLFNTLNTIASFTRTDPMKARELLREFSVFFRQTIENSESKITIEKELEQTDRYLQFEYARFGANRISLRFDVDARCSQVLVPAFIVQPLVENAIRHAMSDEAVLHIDIYVRKEHNHCFISVVDDGLGMDSKSLELLADASHRSDESKSKGCGVALRNVARRIEKFYGAGSGIEIASRKNEGTRVTLKLAQVFVEHDKE